MRLRCIPPCKCSVPCILVYTTHIIKVILRKIFKAGSSFCLGGAMAFKHTGYIDGMAFLEMLSRQLGLEPSKILFNLDPTGLLAALNREVAGVLAYLMVIGRLDVKAALQISDADLRLYGVSEEVISYLHDHLQKPA